MFCINGNKLKNSSFSFWMAQKSPVFHQGLVFIANTEPFIFHGHEKFDFDLPFLIFIWSYNKFVVIVTSAVYTKRMSVDFSDPAQLEQVLEALGANNTEIIREAERTLRPFTKKVNCIPSLLQQVQHSTNVSVRHVSALILKKK
jgi:predicted lactoylglutathione lyase